jgi:acyl carrier protein phosphodiesterase
MEEYQSYSWHFPNRAARDRFNKMMAELPEELDDQARRETAERWLARYADAKPIHRGMDHRIRRQERSKLLREAGGKEAYINKGINEAIEHSALAEKPDGEET